MLKLLSDVLLVVHIAAGFVALISGLAAATNKIFDLSHRWHIVAGRTFVVSMIAIFLTAVPLSIMKSNMFLLLIAIFSLYLAVAGWSYATNRSGKPKIRDWVRAYAMLAAALAMGAYGVYLIKNSSGSAIVMLVFAAIAIALSVNDLMTSRSGGVTGADRITKHLTMMLAGTIATMTAFLVVNFSFSPAYVLWLAPTVVITPIIIAMASKVKRKGAGRA